MQKRTERINVVMGDASDGHAELVEALLREHGMVKRFRRGRDGAETLSHVRQIHAARGGSGDARSVLLLDWWLPDRGGLDVLKTLRRDERYDSLSVIMMATASNDLHAEQCRKQGGDAYLSKWTVLLGMPVFLWTLRSIARGKKPGASTRLNLDANATILDVSRGPDARNDLSVGSVFRADDTLGRRGTDSRGVIRASMDWRHGRPKFRDDDAHSRARGRSRP